MDGVSGSCMVVKREVVEKIGYFDERFFAYQEDSDYCLRAKYAGWSIFYNPKAKIMHVGGVGGSNSVPMKAIFEWHRSYFRYYFKHFSKSHSIFFKDARHRPAASPPPSSPPTPTPPSPSPPPSPPPP